MHKIKTSLIIFVLIIAYTAVYLWLNGEYPSKISQEKTQREFCVSQLFAQPLTNGNKLIIDKVFGYQFEIPSLYKTQQNEEKGEIICLSSLIFTDNGNFLYEPGKNKAYISSRSLGVFDEPIEKTSLRAGVKEFVKININGNEAVKSSIHQYDGGFVFSVVIKNSNHLTVVLQFDVDNLVEKQQDIDTIINSIRFMNSNPMLGQDSTLYGTAPHNIDIFIYRPISHIEGGEKKILVAKTTSDKNGRYRVPVPSGTYSLYPEDSCNSFDGYANSCMITILPGQHERNISFCDYEICIY